MKWIAPEILGIGIHQRAALEVIPFDHQPADMAPEKPTPRAVRVQFVICVLVMPAMDCNPIGRTILPAATSQDHKGAFDPNGAAEAAVREEAVIADRDAHHADNVVNGYAEQYAGPAEEPGDER